MAPPRLRSRTPAEQPPKPEPVLRCASSRSVLSFRVRTVLSGLTRRYLMLSVLILPHSMRFMFNTASLAAVRRLFCPPRLELVKMPSEPFLRAAAASAPAWLALVKLAAQQQPRGFLAVGGICASPPELTGPPVPAPRSEPPLHSVERRWPKAGGEVDPHLVHRHTSSRHEVK